MTSISEPSSVKLATAMEQVLGDLVAAARQAFGDDLRSVILFGSGAEGRLRMTSDLNLLIVLRRFEKSEVDSFREPLRVAYVAGRVSAMFVLEAELPDAAEAFAVKFNDLGRRRRILFGDDLIKNLSISREARIVRLRQVLMNLMLRLRERYAAVSLREEQLVHVVADFAGPLRASAATLLELEGQPVASPKEALEKAAESVLLSDGGSSLALLTEARSTGKLPPQKAGPLLFDMIALAEAMKARTERLG